MLGINKNSLHTYYFRGLENLSYLADCQFNQRVLFFRSRERDQHMEKFDEFTRFYFNGDTLILSELINVPDEIESFWTVYEASAYLQSLGCRGQSLHVVKSDDHVLAISVLRWAVTHLGKIYPVIYRGTRNCGDFELKDHKILFGSTNINVAREYGEIEIFNNVRAFKTRSTAKSIIDDSFEQDEEIIFFPD